MDIFVKEGERLTAVEIVISEPWLKVEETLKGSLLCNVLDVFLGFCDGQATSEWPRVDNGIGFWDGIVILMGFA